MSEPYDGYHKYDREVAQNYDKDRVGEAHWWHEDRFIEQFFAVNRVDRLLDLPVGTGRFFRHYRNVREVTGVDISQHMLEEARKNLPQLSEASSLRLQTGDVLELQFGDREFDIAVVWRLLHLIPEKLLPRAIGELCRVTSGSIVVQTYVPHKASLLKRLRKGLASRLKLLTRRSPVLSDRPTAWSHIESFGHSQDRIDALFNDCGFARSSSSILDLYEGSEVRGTVYIRQ